MGIPPFLPADQFRHLSFGLFNRVGFAKTDPVADAEHMGIHGKGRNPEGIVQHDVGRFPPDARQRRQCFHAVRHPSVVFIPDDAACGDNISRFAFESAALHQRIQLFLRRSRHSVCVWPSFKNRRRHLVHLLIRALSGKHCRHQHFIWIGKHQLRLGLRIHFLKLLKSLFLLCLCHGLSSPPQLMVISIEIRSPIDWSFIVFLSVTAVPVPIRISVSSLVALDLE